MATILKPSSGDFLLQSDFTGLAFGLFRDPVVVQSQLFDELSRYGLRPQGVRYDAGGGTLGDATWTYQLPDLRLIIRLRLERIEIHCYDLNQADLRVIEDVTVGVLKRIERIDTAIKFKVHSLIIAVHAALENMSASNFISGFVRSGPDNLGPGLGNAIVFYYGAQGKQQSAAVTFDLSARVKGGLFTRVQIAWDGAQTSIPEIPQLAESQLRAVLAGFGLELARR